MARKPKSVATEEVASTKQVLDRGEVELTENVTVETTTAVFKEVQEVEGDKERGAHQAVFTEGEPRAADLEAA